MRPTMREVFERLVREGHFAAEDERRISEQLAAEEAGTPWFVKALMGAGAWVATALFLVFLALADVFDSEGALLVLGGMLVGAAILLRHASAAAMAAQAALAMSLVGQVMLVYAVAELSRGTWAPGLALLALSVLLIRAMPDPVHRFLSTLAAVASALYLLYDWNDELAPTFGFALVAGGMAWWWLRPAALQGLFAELRGPVGHGLSVATLAAILPDSLALREGSHALAGSVILAGVVLWVEATLLRQARGRLDRTAWGALGLTVLIALATVRVPGVQAALVILLLAVHRREPLLFGEGVVAFVFYLSRYYYALELTLLHKSLVLVGSGAALLAIWRFLLPAPAPEEAR